ncbi:conserved hypothetical protein [Streptomyces sviceus ATCC 29083]|uniref:Uncharacterized protein n=1 Tax=Streptomyces sviceus (strain ATCC 29083 / DSM 924 / JCM 4929 / NBRC 13980 / NCIMB 11184 / NRRL 5439 / UC 5370) TaxID=463191 RepID=B5HMF8_STRX2|nr:conserved hypothetical protein [Streptomyces sviceus ATCC 29083]
METSARRPVRGTLSRRSPHCSAHRLPRTHVSPRLLGRGARGSARSGRQGGAPARGHRPHVSPGWARSLGLP